MSDDNNQNQPQSLQTYDSQDQVPESLQNYYTEKDGKFVPNVGENTNQTLQNKLSELTQAVQNKDKEIANLKSTQQTANTLPEETLKFIQGLQEQAKTKEQETLYKENPLKFIQEIQKGNNDRAIEEKDQALQQATKEKEELLVKLGENALQQEVSKGIQEIGGLQNGALPVVLKMAADIFRYEDGRVITDQKDDKGIFLTLPNWIKGLQTDMPYLFTESKGVAANGGATGEPLNDEIITSKTPTMEEQKRIAEAYKQGKTIWKPVS